MGRRRRRRTGAILLIGGGCKLCGRRRPHGRQVPDLDDPVVADGEQLLLGLVHVHVDDAVLGIVERGQRRAPVGNADQRHVIGTVSAIGRGHLRHVLQHIVARIADAHLKLEAHDRDVDAIHRAGVADRLAAVATVVLADSCAEARTVLDYPAKGWMEYIQRGFILESHEIA